MSLPDDLKDKFITLISTVAMDAGESLSQLLGQPVVLSPQDFAEPMITDAKFNCSAPQALVTNSITAPSPGLVALIADLNTAWAVSDYMTGGDGTVPEAVELDEAKQSAFQEAVNQSLTSAINKLMTFKEGFSIGAEAPSFRLLDPANEESLAAPDGAGETTALKFSININEAFNGEYQLELSTELAALLATELGDMNAGAASAETGGMSAEPSAAAGAGPNVSGVNFAEIKDSQDPSAEDTDNINLLMNISMGLIVELGRSEMPLKDILKLTKGSVIELDRLSGEPVDLFVNNKLIARGEVVVIDDNFGLRLTQLAGKLNSMDDVGLLAVSSSYQVENNPFESKASSKSYKNADPVYVKVLLRLLVF